MNQSKLESIIETMTHTLVRLPVNYALAWLIYPLLGWEVTQGRAMGATLLFTVSSLILGYFIRRFFNAGLHRLAKDLALKLARTFDK